MEVERERLKLRDDPELISPPTLDPAWQCGMAIVIRGFIASATLDIELDGIVILSAVPGGFPQPNGRVVHLSNPLIAGQKIRTRQRFGGVTSTWSGAITVLDHKVEYPAGPPRPQINPAPVFQCGSRTGVANLLVGSDVWINADANEVGRVAGAAEHQGINVTPPYSLSQSVVAWTSLCGDPGPPSATQVVQGRPAPMPTPAFLPVYADSQQATITTVVNGARLTLSRNGIFQFSFLSWGYQHTIALNPPFTAGETLSVTQQLCPGDAPSGAGTTTVLPCSALPAPGVEPVQAGDTRITLSSFVSDARIQVYVNGLKKGEGSGPVVTLSIAVTGGDTIDVLQQLGTCISRTAQELKVLCVAPPLGGDPSARDLFPVGTTSYDAGSLTVTSGNSQQIAGTIYYPADADGADTPFNARVSSLGAVPLVVLVHGRHGGTTSHLGYDYFQQQLARMGLVVVSVDCNASDQWSGWAGNIRDRADLVIASIAHVQSLHAGGDPIFGGRVDFSRVGLMGHSRGGDAVVLVPEILTLAGVAIQGVISLGPVNSGASSGHPKNHAFMTILPASDGDVDTNSGAQFYDGADPAPFKSQLYVHYANHNFFNRQWINDDTNGGLPVMARTDHERILSVYGCAFFRNVLLGHATLHYLDGSIRPVGIPTGNVHLSFEKNGQVSVDNHEDGNGISLNSMPASTSSTGGLVADEYPFAWTAVGRFNDSFFGNSIGMVARAEGKTGTFRSQLDKRRDLRRYQIWIRAAEVYNGADVPAGATGFMLGLEDDKGVIAWVDCDGVGGLPRPLDRRAYDLANAWDRKDKTKTMLKTLRFPVSCFKSSPRVRRVFDPKRIVAVLLRANRADKRALAFDDLQIVQL